MFTTYHHQHVVVTSEPQFSTTMQMFFWEHAIWWFYVFDVIGADDIYKQYFEMINKIYNDKLIHSLFAGIF